MLSQMQDALFTNLPRDGTKGVPKKRARSQSPGSSRGFETFRDIKSHLPCLNFYFEDGSTVILVEHVLFKV